MKKYTTIYCLTAITIVGLITHYPQVFTLWIIYGVYKVFMRFMED